MPAFDFDAARRERLRARDPITITLGGETFTCLPIVPFGASWGLIDAPALPDPTEGLSFVYKALAAFVADCLIPEDVDRWWALFTSKTEIIDGVALREVTDALTAAYTGRPTSPSTDSSDGRPKTSPASSSQPEPKASATSAA